MELDKKVTAKVDLPNPRKLVVVTPEQPEMMATAGMVEIPTRSAAVILEQ